MELQRDAQGRAHIVALSGGKDSTALALLMRDTRPDVPVTYVYTPTGDELPEMEAHIAALEARLGQPVRRLYSAAADGKPWTLSRLIEAQNALPNHRMRWCTRILKIEPMQRLLRAAAPATLYVGLRADEEERRGLFGEGLEVEFPLREAGMGVDEVWGYLRKAGVSVPPRTDCARCYHQKLVEWKALWRHHPELYAEAAGQEALVGRTFRSANKGSKTHRDGWPVRLVDLAEEFARGRPIRGEQAYWDRLERGEAPCRVCSL